MATRVPGWGRLPKWLRRTIITIVAFGAAVTTASYGYNLATDGAAPRPAGLRFVADGGFTTRYLEWGSTGTPVVLIPGAFESADAFSLLGPALAADRHRVYAIDLTGIGYSAPSPPFSAGHLAEQLIAFLAAEHLTGPDAAVLVGHSAGAADVGIAAVRDRDAVRAVVFLDGDATGLPGGGPGIFGALLVNPFRTTILRLAVRDDSLIRKVYSAQCGPACPALSAAGVNTWRWPLEQPGFSAAIAYTARNGITAMTSAQFAALRADPVRKMVIVGANDPQMSRSDATATASAIGAPPPVYVPGRHLTMITSPAQVAALISRLNRLSGRYDPWRTVTTVEERAKLLRRLISGPSRPAYEVRQNA